jgi:hypothetical protein
MTSKAQRRKRKISLPGGQQIDQRPTGPGRPPKEDPMRTVTHARIRRTGILDPKEAQQPICGDDMGLCIRAMSTGDDRAMLVNTWAAISASHRNYRLLIIGATGTPQGAAIPMMPEPMETDPSLRVDLRTHDQRIEAAKRGWDVWEGKIRSLSTPNLRWALNGALSGFMGDGALWRDQGPTTTGKTAVQALRLVAA